MNDLVFQKIAQIACAKEMEKIGAGSATVSSIKNTLAPYAAGSIIAASTGGMYLRNKEQIDEVVNNLSKRINRGIDAFMEKHKGKEPVVQNLPNKDIDAMKFKEMDDYDKWMQGKADKEMFKGKAPF